MEKILEIVNLNIEDEISLEDVSFDNISGFYQDVNEYRIDCYKFFRHINMLIKEKNLKKSININYSYSHYQGTFYISIYEKVYMVKERVDKITLEKEYFISKVYLSDLVISKDVEILVLK